MRDWEDGWPSALQDDPRDMIAGWCPTCGEPIEGERATAEGFGVCSEHGRVPMNFERPVRR